MRKTISTLIILTASFMVQTATAQIAIIPPGEWANSVPNDLIQNSPKPNLNGEFQDIDGINCKSKSKTCISSDSFNEVNGFYGPGLIEEAPYQASDTKQTKINFDGIATLRQEGYSYETISYYIQKHRWRDALNYSNAQVLRFYSSPSAYYQRALIFYAIGQSDLAIRDLDAAQFWLQKYDDINQYSDAMKAAVFWQRALIYARLGYIEKANADLASATKLNFDERPEFAPLKKQIVEILSKNANSFVSNSALNNAQIDLAFKLEPNEENCAKGFAILENAAPNYQNKKFLFENLTRKYISCGNYSGALKWTQEAVTLAKQNGDSEYIPALDRLADVYGKFVNYDAALKTTILAYETNKASQTAHFDNSERLAKMRYYSDSAVDMGVNISPETKAKYNGYNAIYIALLDKQKEQSNIEKVRIAGISRYQICNGSGITAQVGVRYYKPEEMLDGTFAGWYELKPNQCTKVFESRPDRNFFYSAYTGGGLGNPVDHAWLNDTKDCLAIPFGHNNTEIPLTNKSCGTLGNETQGEWGFYSGARTKAEKGEKRKVTLVR